MYYWILGYLIRIPDVKILRIYGQEIERKIFPVPDKVTLFRSKRVPVQLKADEDLKDVSLHHVIRSAESPFAEMLKEYDEEFKHYTGYNSNASRKVIDDFNKVILSRLIVYTEFKSVGFPRVSPTGNAVRVE